MSPKVINAFVKGLRRASMHQRIQGDRSKGTGLSLIAHGIKQLPNPVIGVPMIVAGIVKLFC